MSFAESMQKNLSYALSSAILTLLLTFPILGVHLEQDANGVFLTGSYMYAVYAALAVFAVQLLLPMLRKSTQVIPESLHISKHMEANREWVLGILIVIGLILPFVAGRGTIDVATLALIYVLLGLGLNVVVGYAGLLDLGYVGFYADAIWFGFLDVFADCGGAFRYRRHFIGLSSAALTRRLSGDCHFGLWRNYSFITE